MSKNQEAAAVPAASKTIPDKVIPSESEPHMDAANVWCMNLKDNREINRNEKIEEKFNICLKKNIIAIGWGLEVMPLDWEEYKRQAQEYYGSVQRNLRGFQYAVRQIEAMKEGDLVWARHPKSKEYYIFKIRGRVALAQDSDYYQKDIVSFREVEALRCNIESKECLPEGITWRNLISRTAIRPVCNSQIIQKTKECFQKAKVSQNKNNEEPSSR